MFHHTLFLCNFHLPYYFSKGGGVKWHGMVGRVAILRMSVCLSLSLCMWVSGSVDSR